MSWRNERIRVVFFGKRMNESVVTVEDPMIRYKLQNYEDEVGNFLIKY